MTKFGLGKGLSELRTEMGNTPEIAVLAGGERVVVRSIPLTHIAPNPNQPRKTFDDADLADLAKSIREKGVLQPILVRGTVGGAHPYEIIAGERRWRAGKLAGISEIPALVKQFSTAHAMEIALIENVQRENLNPVEEGEAYKNLMDKCGYDLDDVSRLIGKSESYVRNIMRIISLPESVRKMVQRGELSASHARTIAVAENPMEMARKIIDSKMTVSDAERMMKVAKRTPKTRNMSGNALPFDKVAKLEKKLKTTLGFPAKIRERRGGAGDIIISFASRIQMEELIKKLTDDK